MIPQPTNASIIASEHEHTSGVYPKRDLAIVRGTGATLWDAEGREYIDCVGGQGAANLGHAHPAIVAIIQTQAATLITCPEIFPNDQRAAYQHELLATLPAFNRVFLCNSGTEAIEGALKFARLVTEKRGVVAAVRGFHGRTFGALSATWEPKYREPFLPLLPDFIHIPYNNLTALEAAITETTGAVLLETVQGEGGVRPATPAFLQAADQLCRERGALLIIDEVQTGFGRTGTLWSYQQHNIQPALLTMAKSMAGGIPMGAIALHADLPTLPLASHGSTFGGNPLACAAARTTLQTLLDEELPRQAAEKGMYLVERIRALNLPIVREVRHAGLLVGLELKERVQPYLVALMQQGVLALPAGPTVLRLLPPLVISYEQLDMVITVLHAILQPTHSDS